MVCTVKGDLLYCYLKHPFVSILISHHCHCVYDKWHVASSDSGFIINMSGNL